MSQAIHFVRCMLLAIWVDCVEFSLPAGTLGLCFASETEEVTLGNVI